MRRNRSRDGGGGEEGSNSPSEAPTTKSLDMLMKLYAKIDHGWWFLVMGARMGDYGVDSDSHAPTDIPSVVE